MPTPVGHVLGALLLTAPLRARYRLGGVAAIAAVSAAAVAPDIDLLIGRHSAETHSAGAAALTAAIAFAVLRARPRAWVWAALLGAAVLSHALLDWLGTDTSAPIGIMALWPFSNSYYESDAHVFMAVSRRYGLPEFWVYNLSVLGRELLLLGIPVAAAEWWVRRRT